MFYIYCIFMVTDLYLNSKKKKYKNFELILTESGISDNNRLSDIWVAMVKYV